jgi:hypothetical protein
LFIKFKRYVFFIVESEELKIHQKEHHTKIV